MLLLQELKNQFSDGFWGEGNLTRTVNVISKETYDSQCLIKDIEFRKFDEEV